MKVFGYIRFSYFGQSDVRLAGLRQESETTYFDRLFDPLRMATRFHLFENLCLPALAAQTDPDFAVVVLASVAMPDTFKARLETAVARVPALQVHYSAAPHVNDALTPVISDLMQNVTGNSVHFRLDDDDALAAGHVANLRRIARHLYAGTVISMSRGLHLFSHAGRPYLTPKIEPYIAAGWARIHKPGDTRNPFAFHHRQIASRVPSYLNPRPLSYIHTLHPHSDTSHHHPTTLPRLARENAGADTPENLRAMDQLLADAFPAFSAKQLLNVMATLPTAAV